MIGASAGMHGVDVSCNDVFEGLAETMKCEKVSENGVTVTDVVVCFFVPLMTETDIFYGCHWLKELRTLWMPALFLGVWYPLISRWLFARNKRCAPKFFSKFGELESED